MTEHTTRRAAVVVVGSGFAGTAAALAANPTTNEVVLVAGSAGASTLWTGAVDAMPWEDAAGPHAGPAMSAEFAAALDALDAFVVRDRSATLVTAAGLVRPARGREAGLLDVQSAAPGPIAVVRAARPGWDADSLARAWGDPFVAIDAELLRYTDEEVVPDAEFAARHDDEARLDWLSARIREALARVGSRWAAVVLPPSLGVERERSGALSSRVGAPCGEAVGMPGGPVGLRFEAARDRAIRAACVRVVADRATRVDAVARGWRVHLGSGGSVDAAAVVLAAGGLVGGGLEYAPSEFALATALPPSARVPIRLTLVAPATVGAYGAPLELPSSLFGAAPESIAPPFVAHSLLERAGILVEADGAVTGDPGTRGVFAAGEIVADAPRTCLAALASGCVAGAAAARYAVTAPPSGPPVRGRDEATASPP